MSTHNLDREVYYKGFFSNFLEHIKQLFNFDGNESRKTFWLFVLANFLVSVVYFIIVFTVFAGALDQATSPVNNRSEEVTKSLVFLGLASSVGFFSIVFYIVQFFLTISPVCRRLADAGFSRLWILATFVPFLNLAVFIFLFFPTKTHYNKHVLKYNKENILAYAEELKNN